MELIVSASGRAAQAKGQRNDDNPVCVTGAQLASYKLTRCWGCLAPRLVGKVLPCCCAGSPTTSSSARSRAVSACSRPDCSTSRQPGAPQGRRAPSSPCWDHCRPCGMTGTCGTMGGMLYGCLQLLNARGAPPWASASAGHAAQTCGASSTRTCRGARAGSAVLRAPGKAAAAAAAPAAPAGCPTRARAARWRSARARAASWSYVCE